MREISIVPIVAILAFWSLPARAQSVSMRISDEGIELRIPGKDPRFFKTLGELSSALPGLRGGFEIEAAPPPAPPRQATKLDPTPDRAKGRKIDITPGKIPALEMLRFLADYTGLSVVHDSKDQTLATMEIPVIAEIHGADDIIVEAHLAASGVLLSRRTLANGQRIIEARTLSSRADGGEPRSRPVVVVGAGKDARAARGRRVGASQRVAKPGSAEVTFGEIPDVVRAQVELAEGEGVLVLDAAKGRRTRTGVLGVLQRYDIVTRIGSRSVRSPRDLVDELARHRRGEEITLRLLRKGGMKILLVRR